MGHTHTEFPVSVGTRRALAVAATALALLTVIGLVALWPSDDVKDDVENLGFTRDLYDAKVVSSTEGPCEFAGPDEEALTCATATVRLLQGPDRGSTVDLDLPTGGTGFSTEIGDVLVLSYDENAEADFQYGFADRNRKPVLWWLAALFAAVVVLLGRLRGLAALAGLGASFVVLLKFILPAIVGGEDPLLVAVVGASAIAFVALYLAHGFGPMTSVALLGTLASLGVTVVLAKVFVSLADLTGFASEEASFVNVATTRIDLAGLVLGGIVIGALGAIDDMTVTQASVVAELRHANPSLGPARLFAGGMRIGRDHVASTVNTLALAYAGASMPLLVLFVLSEQSLGSIVNGEVIATEFIRTLVGSIGLVTAVPLTTGLAVVALSGRGSVPMPGWLTKLRARASRPSSDVVD
jgi:uncharacterized membrane protein